MSYSLGYLGAEGVVGHATETGEEIRLREQARLNAINIWNDYQRLLRTGAVRELMAAEPYSDGALTNAYRLLRRGIAERTNTRVTAREFASMIQSAMAKITVLQIKARALSYAIDINAAYPVIVRVNSVARQLLTTVQRLTAEAQPIRKEATSGAKNGTSGLGFIFPIIMIGAFVIVPALMLVFMESIVNFEGANGDADRFCANQLAATRQACTGEQWEASRTRALALRQQSGVNQLLRDVGTGIQQTTGEITRSPIGQGIGKGLMIAIVLGASAAVGLVGYAVWPYVAGARAPGQRFASAQRRKTARAEAAAAAEEEP